MKTFSITDVGMKRQINQDYVFKSEGAVGYLPNLFLVADGMGGHKAGDFASRRCAETIVEQIRQSALKTPVGILEEAISKANDVLYRKSISDAEYEGMGTTVVAAVIAGHDMYVTNVGDSRLYVVRDKIRQITEDHSLVEEMVRNGELEKKDARLHPNKNIITRAVGTNKFVVADYFEVPVEKGDIVLLCSDGLSNMIEDDEIFRIIRQSRDDIHSSQVGLEQTGDSLIETANRNGGKDNIAVVLIEI